MIKKIRYYFNKDKKLLCYKIIQKIIRIKFIRTFIPSKFDIIINYYIRMGKKLNFNKITTYNEKLQWLKLYDRNPIYTQLVDKYEVRKYISKIIGKQYLIPLIGVWDKFEDIKFSELPNQFVLKCTHDSGGLVICKDKSKFDIESARDKINKNLKKNFYYHGREWPYKNIKPKIICEQYMVDESGTELKDYKFLCFNGEPKAMFIATDRPDNTKFDFFDLNFNKLPFMQHYENSSKNLKKPESFYRMIKLV